MDLARQYRIAWKIWLALFLLYAPVVFGVALIIHKLFRTFTPGFVVAGIWATAWIASGVRVAILRYRLKHSN